MITRVLQNNSLLRVFVALALIFSTAQIWATELELNKDTVSEIIINNKNKALSSSVFNALHQCEKVFDYEVYFLKKNVGTLHRKITWTPPKKTGAKKALTAVVESNSKVHFLFLSSTYKQTSHLHYSPENNHFLTSSFSQKITGLKSREMDTTISTNGLSSTVTLDDDMLEYKSETLPLYDLDTLGIQMRLNLLEGKQKFTLLRQGSEEIKEYHFEVVGTDVVNHKKWGALDTIKIIEVGEHKGTALWFSMKHDYQLVKAKLDLIFSPVVWLNHFEIQCNKALNKL